jgi:hypothetical protein
LGARYGNDLKDIVAALRPLATATLVSSKATTAAGLRADLQSALTLYPEAAVLLIGGVTTLPFFELAPNPATDADLTIQSDNPYGLAGSSEKPLEVYLPERLVGRIPDHPGDDAKRFIKRIQRLCAVSARTRTSTYSYSLSTVSWKGTSALIAKAAGLSKTLDLAPTRAPADFTKPGVVAAGTSHFHFNLHGSDRTAPWYGENAARTSQPAALDPSSVAALSSQAVIDDSLALSQACYGSFLRRRGGDRTPADALSLRFLEDGAAAFVGSTCIAYGASTAMQCSDITAAEFLKAALAGASLGLSLHRSRQAVARSAGSPPSGAVLKTLLQFVLFGDPTAVWAEAKEPEKKEFVAEEALPPLGDYSQWSEAELEEKTLSTDERRADDRAKGTDEWTSIRRFAARATRGASGALPHGSGVTQREVMMTVRSLTTGEEEGATREPVIYFRERVLYPDGGVLDVESTGGCTVRTTMEQASERPLVADPLLGPAMGKKTVKTGARRPRGKPSRKGKDVVISGLRKPTPELEALKRAAHGVSSRQIEVVLQAFKGSPSMKRALDRLFVATVPRHTMRHVRKGPISGRIQGPPKGSAGKKPRGQRPVR